MKYSIKKNTATEKLNRHWEFGIGAANPIAAMKTDFLEQLKYYKDEIGADYVRLGGTFTDSRTQTIFSLSDLYDIPNARKFVTLSLIHILSSRMKRPSALAFFCESLIAVS